jgi:cellulose synthase/poly-beta-1,6-N-acetylglucosamine synthase-like glycosyltransferase
LNAGDTYIFHLDDDSLITEQTMYSVLSFLEDDPKPVSEGLIVYPLKAKEGFRISNLVDNLRPFCCFECIHFMSNGKPAYVHGSNLLVRSSTEEEVGWDNGKTIAEDTLFGVKATEMFGPRAFGWHGGIIEERSPHTIWDLLRQRRRWFYGLFQNLKFLRPTDRLFQLARAVLWSYGFFAGLLSIIALVIPQDIPYLLRIAFTISSLLWLLSYQIGAFFNGKYLPPAKRLAFHALTLVSSPLLGLIECFAPLITLISRPNTFEVIKK